MRELPKVYRQSAKMIGSKNTMEPQAIYFQHSARQLSTLSNLFQLDLLKFFPVESFSGRTGAQAQKLKRRYLTGLTEQQL